VDADAVAADAHAGPDWMGDAPPGPGPPDRLESLPAAEAWRLLRSVPVGRVAFVVAGWPVVLPVNFAVDGDAIVFRTGPGAKLAAVGGGRVAFEADAADSTYRAGWSVLAFGIADEVVDPAEVARLEGLPVRPWAGGERSHWVRIRVVRISGRRVPRAWRYPAALP
jgi:nitroimidazol reductase NimA-like FMN-containing flavoprotein (pyridoxamine 5'-phosphate oxidase superfamily)